MEQYFKIGKLAASFGLKGELILKHSLGKKTTLPGLKKLFIETQPGAFLPYFITDARLKNDSECYIQLEDVDTVEKARKLTPREVWLAADDFKKQAAAQSAISLLGFTLYDKKTLLGEIVEVLEQPHQILCTVIINGKEALIPVHEGSLRNIDARIKKVVVELPDGLLDIYL